MTPIEWVKEFFKNLYSNDPVSQNNIRYTSNEKGSQDTNTRVIDTQSNVKSGSGHNL